MPFRFRAAISGLGRWARRKLDERTWWGGSALVLTGLIVLVSGVPGPVIPETRAAPPRAAFQAPTGVEIEQPPHIVLIVVDTLRADRLGCYGYPMSTSPEIDRLAKQGVRFEHAVAQSAWTRPSFGSFLTSAYPRATGISAERLHRLPERFVTLAEALRRAGYTTLGITANPNINSTFGFDQGFDQHVDSGVRFGWMRRGKEARQSDLVHGDVPLMSAAVVFGRALEMLDAHAHADGLVYLQIDLMDVHEAWDPRVVQEPHRIFSSDPDGDYLAGIHQVSAEIGRFVETLRSRPGFERTLFVITSDHGEGLRSHPHVEHGDRHGFHLYESQTSVPLVVYDAGGRIPRGREIERPVRLLDLMPTLLDIAGVEGPGSMAGRSLVPLIEGGSVELPLRFVVETQFRGVHAVGVYDDTWAYIENRAPWEGTSPRELQRRGAPEDGARTNQLSTHPEEAERLRRFLAAWEREHPPAPAALIGQEIGADELEQLRALGYLE